MDNISKYLITGIINGLILIFLGIVYNIFKGTLIIIALGIVIIGIHMIIFPVATPETEAKLGIKKSKLICRLLGILVILIGFFVIWLDY